jgi:FtsH-binding integral membrane protein
VLHRPVELAPYLGNLGSEDRMDCEQASYGERMQTVRQLFGWTFGVSCAICIWYGTRLIVHAVERHKAVLSLRGMIICAFLPLMAAIYSKTCWAVSKRRNSVRVWGVVACLTFVFMPVSLLAFGSSRPIPVSIWVMLAIGLSGLICFLWRDDAAIPHW